MPENRYGKTETRYGHITHKIDKKNRNNAFTDYGNTI